LRVWEMHGQFIHECLFPSVLDNPRSTLREILRANHLSDLN
jgi:hypothetical protein